MGRCANSSSVVISGNLGYVLFMQKEMLPTLSKKYYLTTSKAEDLQDNNDRVLYRAFEILPGLLSWASLAVLAMLSFIAPAFVAFFIIIFDLYWLIKTIFLSFHLRSAYRKTKKNLATDWLRELEKINPKNYSLEMKSWKELVQLVIFPIYKEGREVILPSLQSLVDDTYPKEKMIVLLAVEERAGASQIEIVKKIEGEFTEKFFKIVTVVHPANVPDEIPGKGSNMHYAGHEAKKLITSLGIPYERVIVSAFDIDTRVERGYFARLTYCFLTNNNPLRTSYQPIPFYTNNIWDAPAFARVVAFSATFWHMLQQERPERQTTFSSHSMPFQALVDVGFWQKNIVSEDSRIFWQMFLHYDGEYRVQPIYYPVHMDANVTHTIFKTFINVYKQQRRWGYGVENVPYFLFGFLKNKLIPLRKKLYYGFTITEGFHSWATNSLIIFLFGWLPLMVGGEAFKETVLSYNLPILTRDIMILAMLGLITSAILTINILPPRPPEYGRHNFLWMILQWASLPFTIIVFGSIPGLEAQTRLMFGKYMGFWVTPKVRVSKSIEK